MTFTDIIKSDEEKDEEKDFSDIVLEYKCKNLSGKKTFHPDPAFNSCYDQYSTRLNSTEYEEWSVIVDHQVRLEVDEYFETRWTNLTREIDEYISFPKLYQYFIVALQFYLDTHKHLSVDESLDYHFIIDYLECDEPELSTMIDDYSIRNLHFLEHVIKYYIQEKKNGSINEQLNIHELVRGHALLEMLLN